MRFKRVLAALLAAAPLVSSMQPSSRADFVIGSTYTIVEGVNFPTDFGPETVTLDQSKKLINGGLLTLKETIIPASGGGQWIDFFFQTSNGGHLASNFNGLWGFLLTGIQLSRPESLADGFASFTVDGVPVSSGLIGIPDFYVRTNPIDPAAGEVFGFVGLPRNPYPPASSI